MDELIAAKLEDKDGRKDGTQSLRNKVLKLSRDYITLGRRSVDFYSRDFDVAHDLFQCYAQMMRKDLENLERGSPRRFILPVASSQISTMASTIAQILFGTSAPHKVENREPDGEVRAEIMNQLLRWNSEQQSIYLIGLMWVTECLLYNRGILYEAWTPIMRSEIAAVERTYQVGTDKKTYTAFVRTKKKAGGYVKYHIVSPYDFLTDPGIPLYRLQEMRFCGHHARVPWVALKQRSLLDVDDPEYVSPLAVKNLKNYKRGSANGLSNSPDQVTGNSSGGASLLSRTSFERMRPMSPTGGDTANSEDGGIIDVYELWIKLIPKDYGISDDKTLKTWRILVGNQVEILSIEESFLACDEFPYAVGEARPSPHYQFTPSHMLELKPVQDFIDYLKNRRQEAISNTVGNIFIVRADKVNVDDFRDPNKEGKIIAVNPEATDTDLNNIIKQVPITDLTAGFTADLQKFVSFMEMTSGATAPMQGIADGDDTTATASAGAQQMSLGRMASIARCLSSEALVPQTRRTVSFYQQFLEDSFFIKIKGSDFDLPDELINKKHVEVSRDVIQGNYDYVPHDGALPTTDAKKVAALVRVLETAPTFASLFTPDEPGNFDLRKIYAATMKAAGVNVENFIVRKPSPKESPNMPGTGPASAAPVAPPEAPQPVSAASSLEPRATDLGGGLTAPTIDVSNTQPGIRPANV